MRILIESTTDAANAVFEVMPSRSDFQSTAGAAPKPVSVVAWGLADALTIPLQIGVVQEPDIDTDADWEPLEIGGAAVVLTAATNIVILNGPMVIRVAKGDTGEVEVGVGLYE